MTNLKVQIPSRHKIENRKKLYFPKRYIFVFLGLMGSFCIYIMRISLSVTIIAMVNQTAITPENTSFVQTSECPNYDSINEIFDDDNGYKEEQYNWDTKTQSRILGAYYYGYVATQIIGGIMAEKYSAKQVFGGGILSTGIICLLIPFAASWSYTALMAARIVQGLGDMSLSLWISLLTSVPLWALAIAHFGHTYGFIIIFTELPTYLNTVLNYDLKSNGLLSALPFFVQVVGIWIASFAADYLRKSNKMSITNIRKLMNSLGSFVPAATMMAIVYAGCNSTLILLLLCIAMAFNGAVFSGFNNTHVEMCSDFTGTLYAITNSLAHISGVLGPMSVGTFTESGATLSNWSKVFYACAGVYVLCGAIFNVFGSAKLQTWGTIEVEVKIKTQEDNKISVIDVTKLVNESANNQP